MRLPLASLVVAAVLGCSAPIREIPSSELPVGLRPVEGATQISANASGDAHGVEYYIVAEFPAAGVLSKITSQIPPQWVPRTEDWVNPGIPTSHVRGWTNYRNLTTSPESWVHAWQSEWQNAQGDLLSISLIYRSPGPFADFATMPAPSSKTLRVAGEMVPRAIAQAMKRLAERQR